MTQPGVACVTRVCVWEIYSWFQKQIWFLRLLICHTGSYNFYVLSVQFRNSEIAFFSEKDKTNFSPRNLCMNFEVLKIMWKIYFWKLDISTIIFPCFVDLIRDPQIGFLRPWSGVAWWGPTPHPTQIPPACVLPSHFPLTCFQIRKVQQEKPSFLHYVSP